MLSVFLGFCVFCAIALAVTYIEKLRADTGVRTKALQPVVRTTYGVIIPERRVKQPSSMTPPLIGRMTRSKMEALGRTIEETRATHLLLKNANRPAGAVPYQ